MSQLVCPVLRCLSNLLAQTDCQGQGQDGRLLIALFLILQCFLQQHPFLVQECLWLLNNLTGECPTGLVAQLDTAGTRPGFTDTFPLCPPQRMIPSSALLCSPWTCSRPCCSS